MAGEHQCQVTLIGVRDLSKFDHLYVWRNNPTRQKLKDCRCRVVARGSRMFSVLLEFEDGERVIASSRSVRKIEKSKD